jgi:glyoxylase-like metal-dependent hydrolase (beta-lactamase superfamily II)
MRLASLFAASAVIVNAGVELPDAIKFRAGSTNVVIVGRTTAIYGLPDRAPDVSRVLLTHARRDVMPRAAQVEVVVPAAERDLFENPQQFWQRLEKERFHDYAQKGTKVPIHPVSVARAVSGGDSLDHEGIAIRVIATPGYTPGAVSYLIEVGGKRIACTGDLIYGDGQIFDLYSLQDAVSEAKARGYHGYAARAGDLIASLRRVAAAKPDLILPARGPAIEKPQAFIERLIARMQRFLASHFEVDALRWYWGDDNHRIRSRAVESPLDVMPIAEQAKLPEDIVEIGNSRLILSRTGAAFLVDAGYRKIVPELEQRRTGGKIRSVDGVWITHYHDDHTDYVNDVAAAFGAQAHFTDRMAEVLRNPSAFRLPCLTTRPIPVHGAKRDGETLRWHEWQFKFRYFPGQTMYHGALLATRDDGQAYLFVGDSFTPSGMDDYCMQNRNILRSGEGYDYCLRMLSSLPKNTWLINQHVAPLFRYSPEQIARMQKELARRSEVLAELSPWPDINYMTDESWARIHPYGSEVRAGGTVELQLRILNHAPERLKYAVTWNAPEGWTLLESENSIALGGRQEGSARARFRTGGPSLQVVTAGISFAGRDLKQWTEALVRVQ